MKRKDTDVGFISGLFEAKGCIKIETPKHSTTACLYVWITDPSFKIMEFLQRFNAKVGQLEDRQYRGKWKDRNAYNVLKIMLPFLITKRDQAEVGIEFFENKEKNVDPKEYEIPLKLRLGLIKKATPKGE